MLVEPYTPEEVFARVPQVAAQTDPVLKRLDQLLEDDQLYQQVRVDLGKRYRYTLVHGRHSTPVEVLLRMLRCKHLYGWSYEETRERVADSLVLRWFCCVYFQTVPDKSTLSRWIHTLRPETLHALNDRVVELACGHRGPHCEFEEGLWLARPGSSGQQSAPHRPQQALIFPFEAYIADKLFILIITCLLSSALPGHFAPHTCTRLGCLLLSWKCTKSSYCCVP